ncbi:transmembrane channel-like protein 5 [Hypomesus transpacificus]|uniref:transmembrane channel-like protein 5 n=1 Tax=Hypomesus transpacificus TaxID=137520 RepID=UPI001F08531A|nr:transmembrane channel-like protein 5 [Hypomesus transpacificus]
MSHYNGGHFNPAYHDSETLEVDRSPSRNKHQHSNPYAREANAGGQRGWQQPEGRPAGYDDALEKVPWGGWQEGSWRGRDSIPMGLLSPRPESPKWLQHELNHSTFQIEPAAQYDPSPSVRQLSAFTGNMTMRWRGMRRMSLFPGGEAAMSNLGLTEHAIRAEIENEEQDLVKELVALSTRDRIRAIQGLPMSFEDKKHIRSQVLAFKSSERARQFTCFAECTENMSLSFRRCGIHMTSARQALKIWQGTFKEIGGKFGTGVLSYFLFLKWLLMLNFFSFLVNFGFITVPQLVHNATASFTVDFQGLELLTGAGHFTNTVMYYGAYSHETTGSAPTKYNMQLAYFFTIAAYMVLCGGALIYSMASSFKRNYVLADPTSGGAWTLLCTWDFNVTNERAVRQRKNNLRVQLKESLSENAHVAYLPMSERLKHLGVHLATWVFSTVLALGCGAAVYFLCQFDREQVSVSNSLVDEAATLLLPFVVSLINLVVPLFYSLVNKFEHYSHPRMQIYAIIVRNVILKMSILGILCYYWMNDVANDNSLPCWESVVGQNLYRLVIVDFIFLMLGSFFGEFLRNVIGTKCLPNLGVPEFDVARNVLDLIYAQTLAWIGIYFSPLLPVIQIIKFFILFYLKKVSLTQNCQPPRRSGRAAQMQTIFIALLFFPSFLGALSMLAHTVWSLPPSKQCGPFRGLSTTFDAVSIWMESEQTVSGSQWFVWIYENVVRSEVFYFLIALIIIVFIYILWQITKGRKLLIVLLKQQIVNEGKDKTFLLEKLQALQKSNQNKQKPKKAKQSKRRQDDQSSGGQSSSNALFQALLARQRLEEEENGVGYNGAIIPSDISVSTTSSAMMQAMLTRQKAEEQDVADYYGAPLPGHNANSKPSALIQVMQARQRAEEEDAPFGAQVSSQDPMSTRSSAVEQAMRARQKAEEEENVFRIPAPPENPAPLGSSALIQAMLARQQAQNEYDDGY